MADAVASEAELRERLVGHRFPGGAFKVEDHERFLSHDAMLAPPLEAPLLHPVWVLLGALRGMGITIDELIELGDATPADGVVFGETILDQKRPLRSGEDYVVHGGIVDLRRRTGKRAGTFDLLTFRLQIDDADGNEVAASTQTFVFPRKGVDDAR